MSLKDAQEAGYHPWDECFGKGLAILVLPIDKILARTGLFL
jgi:hypothetical protein